MKNKKWLTVATLCMSLATGAFVGCGDGGESGGTGNGGSGHTHSYTVQNTDGTYLKAAADCTHPAEYYYVCECGEKGTETYAYGEAEAHEYENGVCGDCDHECPHTETEWKTDSAAGCIADGSNHSECKECGVTVDTESVTATGHTFEEGTCKVCNADLWDGTADSSWYSAETTEYTLTTAEQLAGLSQLVAGGNTLDNTTFTLSVSMDLNGLEWSPIGTDSTNYFKGALDGNGLEIANMKITNGQEYAGLFGYAREGTVKNLSLRGVDIGIDSGFTYVGGIAGYLLGETVENCRVQGNISVGTSTAYSCYAGGAFGIAASTTVNNVVADCAVENVYSDETVYAGSTRYLGGFAGELGGETSNSYATGDVTVKETILRGSNSNEETLRLGGFAGKLSATTTDCYATGDVSFSYSSELVFGDVVVHWTYLGGFAGELRGKTSNSYATGKVTADKGFNTYAGGFVGEQVSAVENCYATGAVEITDYTGGGYAGGFTGEAYTNVSLTKCYATGNVSMMNSGIDAGGLIGRGSSMKSVQNCYATGNVTLVDGYKDCAAGGLIGRNTTLVTNVAGTVENSYATGDVEIKVNDGAVTTTDNLLVCYAGGLIGFTEGEVRNAYASGDVNATAYTKGEARIDGVYAGGLVGYAKSTSSVLSYTYASGNVQATTYATVNDDTYASGKSYAAGLVAYLYDAKVANSYATGDVVSVASANGSACARAFVGVNSSFNAGKVAKCYVVEGQSVTYVKGGVSTPFTTETPYTPTTATALETLQSAAFCTETLGWTTANWSFADGQYPTLK